MNARGGPPSGMNYVNAAIHAVMVIWGVGILIAKFRLAHYGLATDDLYNYANALYNTNFWDKWLFVARYEVARHIPSLMFDHWQPTTLLLWPLVNLFGPHSLLVVQSLAPPWAVWFLLKICDHLAAPPLDRLFCAGICLFSPYMMLPVIDSIEGYHANSLLLVFGAPLAWAAVTRRWLLALVLMLLFINVRENGPLYVAGAAAGYLIFGNAYFDSHRRALAAGLIAAVVFVAAVKLMPHLFNTENFTYTKIGSVLKQTPILHLDFSGINKDWAALAFWLWPAFAAPGALAALGPDAAALLLFDKDIVAWYGMALVFTGSLAAVFGLTRIRRFADERRLGGVLSLVLVVHLAALSVTSARNAVGKVQTYIDIYGYHVPAESLAAARGAIDTACRTSVFFQAMKGFGDLPYLQYPHPSQAAWARFIVISKRAELALLHNRLQREFVETIKGELSLRYEDGFLAVYERPALACVKTARADGN